MPYLQLDVNGHYTAETKKILAQRLSQIYADVMQSDLKRITVTVRGFNEGSVWRNINGEWKPAALLMCDIRQGRPAETRAVLAKALIDTCVELLDITPGHLNVEFTQHSGDEMYHAMLGGLSDDWVPNEK